MIIFKTIEEARSHLARWRPGHGSLGFVPTMGALHQGHGQLIQRALEENAGVVCSIFVNPIQFNKPDDLEKYPRPLGEDIAFLDQLGCTFLFHPEVAEMYPEPPREEFDFGLLEQVMEGKFRPGHFKGVAIVVKRLFEIIQPDKAYFGEKDYQQLQVVRAMVLQQSLPVDIISCATVREPDGLAMSSRNRRLSPAARQQAPWIYKTLLAAREQKDKLSLPAVRQQAVASIESKTSFRVEYLEFADAQSLQAANRWDDFPALVCCVAVWAGDVRLIDNILIL